MDLSNAENTAINLLKPHQALIQSVLTADGNIDLSRVYGFFESLSRQLDFAKAKRRGDFIENEASPPPQTGE
jgi:hypothetical protein